MLENEYTLSRECFADHSLHERVSLPPQFIIELTYAHKRIDILQVVARWLPHMFNWDRASIAFGLQSGYLSLVSVIGNKAIPAKIPLPVDFTLVGRVFKSQTLIACHQLSLSEEHDCRMLVEGGIVTCMDAPILYNKQCFGTINVGRSAGLFTQEEAVQLFCIASMLGLAFSSLKDS